MTAITPISPIMSVSFARRGLVPRSFVCACCNLQFDRDEHMKGDFDYESWRDER